MVVSTLSRQQPRSSHSHTPHTSKPSSAKSTSKSSSGKTSSRPTTTPLSPLSRVPPSVGQSLPPSLRRTPGIQTDVRTPSPNYFGLAFDSGEPRDSAAGPKANWSPPTSSIVSLGPTSPKHIPLDGNPDFEAFRRQSQTNNGFNLSHGSLSQFASTPGATSNLRARTDQRPRRTETQNNPPSPRTQPQARDGIPDTMDLDHGGDSAYASSSESIRPSESSINAPSFFDIPRQQSPANATFSAPRNAPSRLDERHPRLSLPPNRGDPPSPQQLGALSGLPLHRADTLPSALEDGPGMLLPSQLKDMLDRHATEILLLDLRVFPQFSQSRIQGALNLCIPTTLLKRPSFNLQKLRDTFTNPAEKERFARWRTASYIIVYDAFSSDKKDAVSAVNTLKKFANEGWNGTCHILKGGFAEYSKRYPESIDTRSTQDMQLSKVSLSLGTSMPGVAPVAGGCVMPSTKNAANPFFSNIRQNQDLIGGVGQMDVKMPAILAEEIQKLLPRWLQKAAAEEDHGKMVADKFLRLELDEQSRMRKALSSGVRYNTAAPNSKDVQIAGVEKGGKNRYNNIWPFEHARVRLQGRPQGACDYVNASHIKSEWSNKQYIASQGPLPATFEDFWSVIWDHDVRVIVMLTAESEGGQLKCHPYWSSKEYGPLKLKALSEKKVSLDPKRLRPQAEQRLQLVRRKTTNSLEADPTPQAAQQPHVIIRKFTLSHSAHPFSPIREITQVHYSSWPDFGAPASPGQLLALVDLSNLIQRSNSSSTEHPRSDEPEPDVHSRPMLVHCSAGCGRTGTFCTIDSVIDMLKRQRKENRSGVTPMEIAEPDADGDYLGKGKGKQKSKVHDDWVFDQDVDLVQKAVEDFRGQRLSMVQSLRQYVLCYETVLEWIAQQYGSPGGKEAGAGRERSGSDPHKG